MKNKKRCLRRYKSKCKFEKRLRLWVVSGMHFRTEDTLYYNVGGNELEIIRNDIRKGLYWTFLKDSSTPCSCYMCKGQKYTRLNKNKLNKIIEEQLYEK